MGNRSKDRNKKVEFSLFRFMVKLAVVGNIIVAIYLGVVVGINFLAEKYIDNLVPEKRQHYRYLMIDIADKYYKFWDNLTFEYQYILFRKEAFSAPYSEWFMRRRVKCQYLLVGENEFKNGDMEMVRIFFLARKIRLAKVKMFGRVYTYGDLNKMYDFILQVYALPSDYTLDNFGILDKNAYDRTPYDTIMDRYSGITEPACPYKYENFFINYIKRDW